MSLVSTASAGASQGGKASSRGRDAIPGLCLMGRNKIQPVPQSGRCKKKPDTDSLISVASDCYGTEIIRNATEFNEEGALS
jgi:hypothetical protein